MIEATSTTPSGDVVTDWKTVEAGVMLYLAFLKADNREYSDPPPRGPHPEAAGPVSQTGGAESKAAAGGSSQSASELAARRELESLSTMRKMMNAATYRLALPDLDAVPRMEDPGNDLFPALTSEVVRPGSGYVKAGPESSGLPVKGRRLQWLGVPIMLTAVAWAAFLYNQDPSSSNQEPAFSAKADKIEQSATAPRPVAVRSTDSLASSQWFFEDNDAGKQALAEPF